jgi:hypothetical protein
MRGQYTRKDVMMEDNPLITMTEEALKTLLNKSFKNGVLVGLQTTLETMDKNIKSEHFTSEEMKQGFDIARLLIGGVYAEACINLSGDSV